MKTRFLPSILCGAIASTLVMTPPPTAAQGVFKGLFKKKDKVAEESPFVNEEIPAATDAATPSPTTSSRTDSPAPSNSPGEAAASALFGTAQSLEAAKNLGKARGIYKDIVKKYPRASVSGESQYKIAEIREIEGEGRKAFDEYQKYIDNYPGGPRFSDAVGRQYVIADHLMKSKKKGFLGIGAAVQPSKMVEMFDQIAANAPRSAVAPRAMYSKGLVHAEQGSLLEAIDAFESLVEEHPKSEEAAEAQYFVVQLREKNSERSFSPIELRAMREAGEDFLALHNSDPRAQDVRAKLGRLENQEADKMFDIGRYYERNGNLRSAAVYYREILKKPGTSRFEDAKERMAKLLEADPSLASTPQTKPVTPQPSGPVTLPSSGGGNPPSFGPTPLPSHGAKPAMRTGDDEVVPIPNDDPVVTN